MCSHVSSNVFFMVTLNKQSKNITGMENSVLQLVVSFLMVAAVLLNEKMTIVQIIGAVCSIIGGAMIGELIGEKIG